MEQSLFIKYVQKYFPGIVVKVVKTINGEDRLPSYLHKTMLTKKQSVDGKWVSIMSDNSNVAADIVAMDSSLPLKSRPALETASGDIPKLGMELKLNENQLTALDTLIAKGADVSEIIAELFADTPRAMNGVYEQLELLFLQGLSTGVALSDTDNVGVGIRVDYGYLAKNKGGVPIVWGGANFLPLTDVENMISKASDAGRTISMIMMDKVTFNIMRKSDEGKSLYATSIGNFGTSKPVPTSKQFLEAFEDEYSVKMITVDRSVQLEKDGVKKAVKPWSEGKIVLLTSTDVGNLVWAKLAEMTHKAANVTYIVADDFILMSKYVLNRPSLGEFTSSQARVVPVITNVEQIYLLDTKTVQA